MKQAVVVCALHFELNALRRAGLDRLCSLVCCGPGALAVKSWADRFDPRGAPVILAGVAGALRDDLGPDTCAIVGAVVDAQSGERWKLEDSSSHPCPLVIASSPEIIIDASERSSLRARTGADLVDCESAMFARCATERRWRWTIIRGVSDGPQHPLPPQVRRWVTRAGRTRVWSVAWSLIRQPRLILPTVALGRASRSAMQSVADVLGRLLEPESSKP